MKYLELTVCMSKNCQILSIKWNEVLLPLFSHYNQSRSVVTELRVYAPPPPKKILTHPKIFSGELKTSENTSKKLLKKKKKTSVNINFWKLTFSNDFFDTLPPPAKDSATVDLSSIKKSHHSFLKKKVKLHAGLRTWLFIWIMGFLHHATIGVKFYRWQPTYNPFFLSGEFFDYIM